MGLSPEIERRLRLLSSNVEKIDFHVLLWGPGPSHPAGYEKRLRIRAHLSELLGPDRVLMSEDQDLQFLVDEHGLRTAEAIQLAAVDAVIVLDSSHGPHTEVATFESELRGKSKVFVPDDLASDRGFASEVLKTLNVFAYSEDEFASCHRIRQTAEDFVRGLRFLKANRPVLRAWLDDEAAGTSSA